MISIQLPSLLLDNKKVIVSADFHLGEEQKTLWYSFPSQFQEAIVVEQLDAFVVGLLPLGLKTGRNIELKGPISEKLFYNLNNYLIPALCHAHPDFFRIKIIARELNGKNLNEKQLSGTGLSCGVDSFTTFFEHQTLQDPFKIDYFTFLNAGSHGDFGGEGARKSFYNRLGMVEKFSQLVRKELIPIDSNLSELLKINFQSTHTFRNISCILNLQKLFKNYYYSSPHRYDFFELQALDSGYFDLLNTKMLSTESTQLYSTSVTLNRVERTEYISNYPETYSHLNVCTFPNHNNDQLNCSTCEKCMRTALTLDLLGKLELYHKVFDIAKYQELKNLYVGQIIAEKNSDQFSKDIFDLLKEKRKISIFHYLYFLKYKLVEFKHKVTKIISKQHK